MKIVRRLCLLTVLVALIALTGCGAEVNVSTKPDKLAGKTLASRANTQLENQNPDLTKGQLTCDDVKYKVGATARCLRTVTLDEGRLVRIGATVTIDRTTKGGHFKIQVDDEAKEFGITGKAVFDDLSTQYAEQTKTEVTAGSCPEYLAGEVGESITCKLNELPVVVTVSEVDPKTFNTIYTFKAGN